MKEPFILNDNILIISNWQDLKQNIIAGMSTKNGGVSTGDYESLNIGYHVGDDADLVFKNRAIIADQLDIPLDNWVFGEQLHTTNIHKVTSEDMGRGKKSFEDGIKATDGLYTYEKNILLATFYADCTPVFFMAPKHDLIGICHAGWQGTVDEITLKMISHLENKEGIDTNDLYVTIGPSIGFDSYRVDSKVIDRVKTMETNNVDKAYTDLGTGEYKLDTKKLNYLQAIHANVPSENISVTSYCSYADKDLFFSFRRDNKKTGRMLGFICQK